MMQLSSTKRLLLENVNLEVASGERLLIVLPASGGKSLLLGCTVLDEKANDLQWDIED